jgi:hypothetical protein
MEQEQKEGLFLQVEVEGEVWRLQVEYILPNSY